MTLVCHPSKLWNFLSFSLLIIAAKREREYLLTWIIYQILHKQIQECFLVFKNNELLVADFDISLPKLQYWQRKVTPQKRKKLYKNISGHRINLSLWSKGDKGGFLSWLDGQPGEVPSGGNINIIKVLGCLWWWNYV